MVRGAVLPPTVAELPSAAHAHMAKHDLDVAGIEPDHPPAW